MEGHGRERRGTECAHVPGGTGAMTVKDAVLILRMAVGI
jgi:hypothetical protein